MACRRVEVYKGSALQTVEVLRKVDMGDTSYAYSLLKSLLAALRRAARAEPRMGQAANDEKERRVILFKANPTLQREMLPLLLEKGFDTESRRLLKNRARF